MPLKLGKEKEDIPMRKIALAIHVVLALMSGTQAFSLERISPTAVDLYVAPVAAACNQAPMIFANFSDEPLFMAQYQGKHKCLEQCAQLRYECEQDAAAKDEPGTKGNWQASRQCQAKYRACLDQCE
jgi:hypothetical protein